MGELVKSSQIRSSILQEIWETVVLNMQENSKEDMVEFILSQVATVQKWFYPG